MFGRAAPRTPWRRLASLLLLLLLPGFVSAAPRFNNTAWPTQEGRSFVLSWTNNDGPVSIILMARRGTSQSPVATIASKSSNREDAQIEIEAPKTRSRRNHRKLLHVGSIRHRLGYVLAAPTGLDRRDRLQPGLQLLVGFRKQ